MRIFMTRWMARFARKYRIEDELLIEAIERAEMGLIDADLGGGVIKQRVGRKGQGRSGGYRTVIAIRRQDKAFFIYAFAKNEQANISATELSDFKDLARTLLSTDEDGLNKILGNGEIEEIEHGKGYESHE